MELIFVREFAVLAETCNFQIAADSLSMSQSALSKHMQKLEDELNVSLFDRSRKNVTLNDNGRIFLKHAKELCRIFDECERELAEQEAGQRNRLNVGFIKVLGQYSLIEQLAEFSMQHPDIQMGLFDQNGDQIKARLNSGECDFIFTAKTDEFEDDEFEKKFYRTEKMKVIMPKDHPLAKKECISIDELRYEKFIEHNTSLEHRIFEKLCAGHDIKPNIIARMSNSSTIMQMVSEGMGISVISSGCSEQYRNYSIVRADIMQETSFDIFLVYRRRKMPKAFMEFIEHFSN